MALEPGGYADKLGNRYEGRWIVRQLLRVLNETLASVVVEAVGDSEEGIDLTVESTTNTRRGEQCKIRNVSSDKWTIADLSRRGVLSAMQRFLDEVAANEFAFVSAVPSTLLHDLTLSAQQSNNDPEAFYVHQVQTLGADRRRVYANFCEHLDLDESIVSDRAKAFSYLKRFFIELRPDNTTTRDDLLHDAKMLVNGNPQTVVAVLADFAQTNLRKTLDATAIWAHLELQGLRPRRLDNDERILPAVRELQTRFHESINPDLIAGELIQRDETIQLEKALNEHAVVVLHGGPGQGKSGVLYELVQKLKQDGALYLPIRLDRNEPRHTTQQFGRDLGLPESPVLCLKAVTKNRPGVLILDQLDAIRWTSRHSLNALEVCKSLVRELRGLRELGQEISVVLACRTYDLQNDPQIKNWIESEKRQAGSSVEIPVLQLTPDIVKSIAQRIDRSVVNLSERQLEILQLPQHLAMWARIVQSRGAFEFQNRSQLMREFLANRLDELKKRNVDPRDVLNALSLLVDYMEKHGSVSAPQSIVPDSSILNALCACGIIQVDSSQATFAHQSYLDYQIANRIVREIYNANRNVCDWLGPPEQQSLFRREQLRQALCLLHEESPTHFVESVAAILASQSIRFHLKHLCLEVLGQLEHPSAKLLEYLDDIVNQDQWKEHILGTIYLRHASYVRHLLKSGTIAQWLECDAWRNPALWLLRSVAESVPDELARVLRTYLGVDEDWNQRILSTIPWDPESDSSELFSLRCDLARLGVYRDHVDWTKLDQERSLALLDAVASTWTAEEFSDHYRRGPQRRSRFETWSQAEAARLQTVVQANSQAAWHLLMSHVRRLAPVNDEPYGVLATWIEGDPSEHRYGMEMVPHAIVELVIAAGKSFAIADPAGFWNATEQLRNHVSPVIQYILVETYAALPPVRSTKAIEWLLEDTNRFSIGTGENEPAWMPAARLIGQSSITCSTQAFRRLERTLIHYHDPDERRKAEYRLSTWRNGYFGDYWGRAQHFLLPALAPERRSDETTGLIGVLSRKYESYSTESFLRRSRGRGGMVGSTLAGSAERISDKTWMEIITNKNLARVNGAIRHCQTNHVNESSVRMFSQDLGRLAKRFPQRFARLALEFPSDVASEYRAAVLEGLTNTNAKDVPDAEKQSWQPAPVSLIETVLKHFPTDSSLPYARNFCWLIYNRAEEQWSDNAITLLKDYACNHPDPERPQLFSEDERNEFEGLDSNIGNLENKALNCVRGVAGLAIGELLQNHPEMLDTFRSALVKLCGDPHPAVRVAGIEACLSVLNIDRDFAINCFRQAVSGFIRVAASRRAVYYFNVGVQSHYDQVAPIIKEMLESNIDEVVQEGASEIAARWLFHDYFGDELNACIKGARPQRKGVARVFAYHVHRPEYFEKCAPILRLLSNDPEKDVRDEMREVANSTDVLNITGGVEFAKDYVGSQAFLDDPGVFIYTLRQYTGSMTPFSALLFAVCEQFLGPLSEDTKDPALGRMHDLSEVLPMLIRLYEEADEIGHNEMITKCLDTFDAMFQKRVGAVTQLAQIIG